jgi:hypothetical protein
VYVKDPEHTDSSLRIIPEAEGTSVVKKVNFHPGIRAYIKLASNGIDLATGVLPQNGAQVRQTYIGAFAYETSTANESAITSPAIHLARLIALPVQPLEPSGPEYATRPDIYGKSSYSMDTTFAINSRTPAIEPYGVIFYRANDMRILSALYKESTITNVILPSLPTRETEGLVANTLRWKDLIGVVVEPGPTDAGLFKNYGGAFRFPNPDNPRATLPDSTQPDGVRYPFATPVAPGTNPADVRAVILQAFLPLTERPVVLSRVASDATLQTSGAKPDNESNPFPMARKHSSGGTLKLRFTDYTLDGASSNFYFYFAQEISSTLQLSPISPIKGPVRLINSSAPAAPVIVKVASQSPNAVMESGPKVTVSVAPLLASEGITELRLYRAYSESDAMAIRTMTLAKTLAIAPNATTGAVLEDLFTGTTPPFGALIYYRVVAYRSILDEANLPESVASLASSLGVVTIADTSVPRDPRIRLNLDVVEHQVDPPGDLRVDRLEGVKLTWDNATKGGSYTLYKMTDRGQWAKVDTFTPDAADATVTYPAAGEPRLDLAKLDAAENVVYHRYKVVAQNSSGLFSLGQSVLAI